MAEISKAKRHIEILKLVIRVLLIFSACSLILSCFLMLINGINSNISYGITWYSIMISMCVLVYFTIPALTVIIIYTKQKNEKVWSSIKRETILFVVAIISLATLSFITNYVV